MTDPQEDDFRRDLAAARSGDHAAFQRLFQAVDSGLKRRSRSSMSPALASWTRASDIVQASYVRIVEHLQKFEGETMSEFRAWVERIAENRAREELRFARANRRKPPSRTSEFRELDSVLGRTNPSPVTRLQNHENLEKLEQALSGLSADQETAIRRLAIKNEPIEAVAQDLGRTVQATRMLLSRARAALALALERLDATD